MVAGGSVLTTACPDCPRKYRPLLGDGPQPCAVLVVAERPGKDENRIGRVLVGKTGQEFDQTYLPLALLQRSGIRCTNAVRCWAEGNRTPSDREVVQCARHHLPGELEATAPSLVILMGGRACSLVPRIELERMHGIIQTTSKVGELFGWSGWILPMYHPALGLHESRWMTQILEDWEALGKWFGAVKKESDLTPPITDYKLIDTREEYNAARSWFPKYNTVAIDTESHGSSPWSIQWSQKRSHGRLIRADDKEAIALLSALLTDQQVIFHHAAHDLEELRKMGIHVTRWRDTMQESFHLGNLPQGLKSLVYRLFRVNMTSWVDVVLPDSIDALSHWLAEACMVAQADLAQSELKQLKTKTKEIRKPSTAESLLTRLLKHTDIESDYDPWLRLKEFAESNEDNWQLEYIVQRCGPYPILGIGNCSMERAVSYACSDADYTLQCAHELERRRANGTFEICSDDTDA